MSDEPTFTATYFNDTTPDTVTGGAGLASSYMDSLASWLMLLPEKAHSILDSCRETPFKSIMVWVLAFYVLGVALYMVRHGRRVMLECRLLTLTPTGLLATGINSTILWCIGQVIFK